MENEYICTLEVTTTKITSMKFLLNIIAAIALALSTQMAWADDYAFLNINAENGENSFQVNQISEITFDTSNMIVHLADGSQQQLPLSGLNKMFFAQTGSQSIGSIALEAEKIRTVGGQLRLQLDEGEKAVVYNMKGTLVYTTNRSGSVQLDNLPKGIYIVRVGNTTKKILTK